MKNKILGKRYATALLDLAEGDQDLIDSFGSDLEAFAKLMKDIPEVEDVLTVPLYPRDFRRETLIKICEVSNTSQQMLGFFSVLLEKNRFDQFEAVLETYKELVDERKGRVHAVVESAKPLSKEEQENVAKGLAAKLGKDVVITAAVEPGLIGGIRAQIGSMVIDGSIRSQLSQIKDRIVKG